MHDPDALAGGVRQLLDRLLSEHRPAAIGLTCQRSTCLVWERESARPLTPAVSWQDASEAARVEALGPARRQVRELTGLQLSPHYAAPKLARLLEELPRGIERAAAGELVAGTLDAYLTRALVGRDLTEPGHAGRTLLHALGSDSWDPALCELFGVPAAALPEIVPSATLRGSYRGVPLTAVAGDQQAALLGHGGWRRGVTAAHFGTGAFVLSSTGESALRHPGLLSAVTASTARGRRFQLEGSVNSAGSAVEWVSRLTGCRIEEWRQRSLDPAALPLVLPALAGVAAPWWRPRARAVVSRLSHASGGPELVGGVLCGVAMRVLDCLEALADAGAEVRALRVSGRLTRLEGLVGLLADAGQVEVEVAADEEAGLAGVARLAAAGLGELEPLGRPPAPGRIVEPRWESQRARAARASWREFVEAALSLPA